MEEQLEPKDENQMEDDIYKITFKKYRQWTPNCNLPLVDLSNEKCSNHGNWFQIEQRHLNNIPDIPECDIDSHFIPYNQWKIYRLTRGISGLLIIPGIIKEEFRQVWFRYFLEQFPREEPNLKSNISLNSSASLENLRWITFGYHHDWNNKMYQLNQTEICIPKRISHLCSIISTFLGLKFKPEAGIVNYYLENSSLCFHTDHSEINHQAPLFSLSLGSSAIFLIGGRTKNSLEPITAILLKDSDLVIMADDSRMALHSIPKIISPEEFEQNFNLKHKKRKNSPKRIRRINVNIRQVY